MTEKLLGLDGGGTKTEAVVMDRSGSVIARCRAGGLDPTSGMHWQQTLADIAAKIGPVNGAILGLPYHGEIPAISAQQAAVASSLFGSGAVVVNDVAVAFEGAFGGLDGVLVLSGTGSMAWSRGPLGVHRVGGWGPVFGDEGSAYWIGCRALARISQQLDGRIASTNFTDALLGKLSLVGGDLLGWIYALDDHRAGIAALAAMVSDLAQAGDDDALALLKSAAQHLAQLGLTASRLSGAGHGWSFAGGVMADAVVLASLTQAMGCTPALPVLPPVGGALLLAARSAGWDTGPEFTARLKAAL